MPASLSQKTYSKIINARLFKNHDHVLIGVSGGSDSVALFRLLNELKHHWGLKLSMAHFNHNLRNDSEKDYIFVEHLARQFDVPFYSGEWPRSKQRRKGSLEQSARIARYQFFKSIFHRANATSLALAHTLNDQAETVLMRFLKGSGLTGYQGILTDRKIEGMRVVRPLLDIQKKELLTYLKQKKQKFIEDQTNKDITFTRNLIRQKILPKLTADINPQLTETLARSANILQADYVYLEKQAARRLKTIAKTTKNAVTFDLMKFKKSDVALQRLMVRLACRHLSGSTRALNFQHIQEVDDLVAQRPNGAIVHFPKNINIIKNSNSLKVTLRKKA